MIARAASAAVAALIATACVDVASEHRCADSSQCPAPGRCELPAGNCSVPDSESCGPGGFRYDDLAGPRADLCVVSTATAGETIVVAPIVFADQTDQTAASCNPTVDAREGYVEIDNAAPQMVFFDTGGTGTDAQVAMVLRTGSCPGTSELPGTCVGPGCEGQNYTQLIASLAPGKYCLGVEELGSPGGTTATVQVIALLGAARQITPGFGSTNETTCGLGPAPMTCGDDQAPTAAYVFALCPRPYELSLAVDPDDLGTLDATLQVRALTPIGPDTLACMNSGGEDLPEGFAPPTMLTGPGPYWVLVKGTAPGQCGDFAMSFDADPI